MKFDVCPDMVFEASWEVTNKCGGIHTVVTSKVKLMQANYGSYYLLGPLFETLPKDFIQEAAPEPFARAFASLAREGIRCVYGTWDIPGKPDTILVDARSLSSRVNEFKGQLWEHFGVDSLYAAGNYHEPLLWGYGVAKLLKELEEIFAQHHHLVGHFHEWLAGFSVLFLNMLKSRFATVFTTHATMLGRTIASNDQHLFENLENIDADAAAKKYGVSDKHTTEKACANTAHVFTTVSSITAKECVAFFGREPDLVPNGLEIDMFPSFDDARFRHLKYKEKLYDYVMAHFFPHYTFDLQNTLFYFYGGRYEYKNKGLDMTIESLARINAELKAQQSEKTIVMFFFVAWNAGRAKEELIENKAYLEELSTSVHEQADFFLQRIVVNSLISSSENIEVVPQEFVEELRKNHSFVKRDGLPQLCTHPIDEANDPTLQHLRRVGLVNNEDDRVKIVFMPAYLDSPDSLLGLEYYEALSGCHLGVFPSYYEPWGYTPLESVAFGVPAISTTTAGFGKYIAEDVVGTKNGMYILDRGQEDERVVDDLTTYMREFSSFSREERIARKRNAHALSTYADWRQLIKYYLQAHCKALHLAEEQE